MAIAYQEVYDPVLRIIDTSMIKATLDDGSVLWIPNDPMNSDFQDYQAWVAAGNTIAPDPAAPVSAPSGPA